VFSSWQHAGTLLCGGSDSTRLQPNGLYGTCLLPLSIQLPQSLEVDQCQKFLSTPFQCHVHPNSWIFKLKQLSFIQIALIIP
jgi:hypothetical protein